MKLFHISSDPPYLQSARLDLHLSLWLRTGLASKPCHGGITASTGERFTAWSSSTSISRRRFDSRRSPSFRIWVYLIFRISCNFSILFNALCVSRSRDLHTVRLASASPSAFDPSASLSWSSRWFLEIDDTATAKRFLKRTVHSRWQCPGFAQCFLLAAVTFRRNIVRCETRDTPVRWDTSRSSGSPVRTRRLSHSLFVTFPDNTSLWSKFWTWNWNRELESSYSLKACAIRCTMLSRVQWPHAAEVGFEMRREVSLRDSELVTMAISIQPRNRATQKHTSFLVTKAQLLSLASTMFSVQYYIAIMYVSPGAGDRFPESHTVIQATLNHEA